MVTAPRWAPTQAIRKRCCCRCCHSPLAAALRPPTPARRAAGGLRRRRVGCVGGGRRPESCASAPTPPCSVLLPVSHCLVVFFFLPNLPPRLPRLPTRLHYWPRDGDVQCVGGRGGAAALRAQSHGPRRPPTGCDAAACGSRGRVCGGGVGIGDGGACTSGCVEAAAPPATAADAPALQNGRLSPAGAPPACAVGGSCTGGAGRVGQSADGDGGRRRCGCRL